MRSLCAILIVVGCALPAHADNERGWSFAGRFQGSSNSSGAVLKANPSLGYTFNRHVQTYVGLPYYFVNHSSNASMSGIGNAYVGARLRLDNPAVNYTSRLELSAPTGDKDRGFSTGRVTVDWSNYFSRRFDSVTPFGSVGLANTISDTSFFVRPFSSLGAVANFEGGATVDLNRVVSVGGSAYAVRASGEQRIISRIVERRAPSNSGSSRGRGQSGRKERVFETTKETVVPANIANDHGFSTWLELNTESNVYFEVGYSRSVPYDFNSIFFGIGFRVGK